MNGGGFSAWPSAIVMQRSRKYEKRGTSPDGGGGIGSCPTYETVRDVRLERDVRCCSTRIS